MKVILTSAQYTLVSLNATEAASRRIAAACVPGEGGTIVLAVEGEALTVLEHVNPRDLADAATRVRWRTLPGRVLHCSPLEARP